MLKIEQPGVAAGAAIREERNLSELDLIQLLEAARANMATLIGQTIALNFAMVIGIYYFLNRAGLVLKWASFILYSLCMFMYLGFMITQSNGIVGARTALRELPAEGLSPVGQAEIAFFTSPVSDIITIVTNLSIWALWLIVIYLLFIWKKTED